MRASVDELVQGMRAGHERRTKLMICVCCDVLVCQYMEGRRFEAWVVNWRQPLANPSRVSPSCPNELHWLHKKNIYICGGHQRCIDAIAVPPRLFEQSTKHCSTTSRKLLVTVLGARKGALPPPKYLIIRCELGVGAAKPTVGCRSFHMLNHPWPATATCPARSPLPRAPHCRIYRQTWSTQTEAPGWP